MRFIENRKKFYAFSGAFCLLSFVAFIFMPKHYGIDMTGGLQIEYSATDIFDEKKLDIVRAEILDSYTFEQKKVIKDLLVYTVNVDSIRMDIGIVVDEDPVKAQLLSKNIRESMPIFFKNADISVTELHFTSVGKSFGKFVFDRAIFTFIVSLFAIAFYLMYSFRKSIEGISSFYFGAITLITLIHDIIIAPGIYIVLSYFFPELKIDLFFVTAILTILGYSINDTIVILDRVRSIHQSKKSNDKRTSKQIFEESIQINLQRSIYTSSTLIIVLVAMLLFWPNSLIGFVVLMILWTVVGTYSSICIAAPILYDLNKK